LHSGKNPDSKAYWATVRAAGEKYIGKPELVYQLIALGDTVASLQ
jgi:hypothetical protein